MNIRIPLLTTLFGGILTVSTQAQTITAPTGQNLTITNPIDVTGAGNSVNIPSDASYKIGGISLLRTRDRNVFVGNSGNSTMTGNDNFFQGLNSGYDNTTGYYNIFTGVSAGRLNTTGSNNTFLGVEAGFSNTTGEANVFMGPSAGRSNTTGIYNLFVGLNSGYANTIGQFNVFNGYGSGRLNTTGNYNIFLGVVAGFGNTSGANNVAIGNNAGYNTGTGSNNTYIGSNADGGAASTNATAIGANAVAAVSNTVVLGNAATTITGAGLGAGLSGLKFANLNSGSTRTAVGGNGVLSVDGSGNVVLVTLTAGTINSVGGPTGPVAEKTWKEQDGYLYNNSTNGVVINGSGLDGNSLIVKGGVLSKEVNVKVEGSESWPDYVFKPSYKRMTLDEVEKFININGHLPNVASATEMAATGNNLNKTDIKLLEKVEELTLYLLEMKKSNEAQNAEIQNLKKQVKSLRRK